jgi:hypothetical protein
MLESGAILLALGDYDHVLGIERHKKSAAREL